MNVHEVVGGARRIEALALAHTGRTRDMDAELVVRLGASVVRRRVERYDVVAARTLDSMGGKKAVVGRHTIAATLTKGRLALSRKARKNGAPPQ